jgi:hypothetical protein
MVDVDAFDFAFHFDAELPGEAAAVTVDAGARA